MNSSAHDLVTIVEFVAHAHHVSIDDVDLEAVVTRLRTSVDAPSHIIRQLADEVGLTTTSVRRPVREAAADADPSCPWFAIRRGPSGALEAIALQRAAPGGAYVIVPSNPRTADRWSWESLCQWLGLADMHAAAEWILAEPSAPLSAMRSPEGTTLEPLARLRTMLVGEQRTLTVAVVYSVVIGLLTLVVPIAVQSLVNTVAFGSALQPLFVLTLFVLMALGFSTAMNWARAGVVEIIQRSIFARVSTDVTWRLLRVRSDAFDHYHGPELVNRFFDTVTVQKSAALLLIDGLSVVMQTLIGMVLLALYHPSLLAFDVLLVVAMLFIVVVLGRGAIKTSVKESKAKYALEAWLEQLAAHLITFKSEGGPQYAIRRSQRLLEDYLTYRDKHFRILIRQIVGSFALQAVASAALLGIGGLLVIERQLTLGQLVAAELLVSGMLSAFTKFGKQLEVFYDLCAATDKLGTLIDLPLERAGGSAEPPDIGPLALTLRDVEMTYDGAPEPVLAVRQWDVSPGERVGLVGPNGSGKSTLADLLYGLRMPTHGTITIDAIDLRAIPLSSLRCQVALVRQVELFPGSVLDNVRLGRDHISYDMVVRALADVKLLDEVHALPQGLDTELHTHGRPLSQRQACRLMIARAIVGRPRLIVLDGVLDQVDQRDEQERLAATLFAPDAPWTLICITERQDVLARCRRVVTLSDGQVRTATRTSS